MSWKVRRKNLAALPPDRMHVWPLAQQEAEKFQLWSMRLEECGPFPSVRFEFGDPRRSLSRPKNLSADPQQLLSRNEELW